MMTAFVCNLLCNFAYLKGDGEHLYSNTSVAPMLKDGEMSVTDTLTIEIDAV